jgi:hypothetical protein
MKACAPTAEARSGFLALAKDRAIDPAGKCRSQPQQSTSACAANV